ncbi:metallophosphoesterase [Jiulongibacter sediminis]|uniref:metallophosphoesterase n=1 Tax=Jiulongibacter sediminis TaxID=1605367 RepID=UPI0026EC6B66|nr:metallophosphoesterase [Jiulongibacter sediminis]
MNEMTLSWKTDVQVKSKVVYYNANNKSQSLEIEEQEAGVYHEVRLQNLLPNSKYIYSIFIGDQLISGSSSQFFFTAPDSQNTQEITLWAMGDFGDHGKPVYVENQKAVSEAFKTINPDKTDLWLWLGDHAYCCGTEEQYDRQVFNAYGPELMNNIPVMPSPGNHEYYATGSGQTDRKIPYFDIFSLPTQGELGGISSKTEAYYSYNYGNVHLISLDSFGLDDGMYRLSDSRSRQYQWLIADLKANTLPWVIVYFHHPPYSSLSHVSDAEQELLDIRRNLVPVFDQYQVDLVLNGHSHVYERSFLMKNHTGSGLTFNPDIHQVQKTNGNYTAENAPYINKTEGTIYAVAGSAGRIDWNGLNIPLPCNAYTNHTEGGSLMIKVNDNRLDGSWITAGKEIKDQFTVFKNVSRTKSLNAFYGELINLGASWPGNYRWSNGMKTREVSFTALQDTVITVTDSLGYLTDTFEIKVAPQPEVRLYFDENQAFCRGQILTVRLEFANLPEDTSGYLLQLLRSSGEAIEEFRFDRDFDQLHFVLPEDLALSEEYYVGLKSDLEFIKVVNTPLFSLGENAYAAFNSPGLLPYSDEVSVEVEITGSLPATIFINEQPFTIPENPNTLIFHPPFPDYFEITQVTNSCGEGSFEVNRVSVLPPLSKTNEIIFNIFPNPGSEFIFIENTENLGPICITLTDNKGIIKYRSINQRQSQKVPIEKLPSGVYIITLQSQEKKFVKKIVVQ